MLLSVEPCVWNTFSIDRDVYEAEINATSAEIVGIKLMVDKHNETTLFPLFGLLFDTFNQLKCHFVQLSCIDVCNPLFRILG